MKLTQEQLESIRQRAENATPCPRQIETTTDGAYVLDADDMIIAATIERNEDATFIAHARTDIPALLDHIAELEAEIKRLHEYYYEKLGEASAREIELKAEVDYNYEKVRELYAWAKSSRDKFAKDDDYTKADARVDGILLTLEALGIKIEGVND